MTRLRNSLQLFLENTEAATGGAEAVTRGILKKNVIKNLANFTGKHLC